PVLRIYNPSSYLAGLLLANRGGGNHDQQKQSRDRYCEPSRDHEFYRYFHACPSFPRFRKCHTSYRDKTSWSNASQVLCPQSLNGGNLISFNYLTSTVALLNCPQKSKKMGSIHKSRVVCRHVGTPSIVLARRASGLDPANLGSSQPRLSR